MVSERIKGFFHRGEEAPLYFWRDTKGHEVDLLVDRGNELVPSEIKSAATFEPASISGLRFFAKLQQRPGGELVYGGAPSFEYGDVSVTSWQDV